MAFKKFLSILLLTAWHLHPALAQKTVIQGYSDENYKVADFLVESPAVGNNRLELIVKNKTNRVRYAVIDIRTECLGIGLTNWQRQFYFQLDPLEQRTLSCDYVITSPFIGQFRVSLGEADRYFDRDKWSLLPREEQIKSPPPEPDFFWSKELKASEIPRIDADGRDPEKAEIFLNAANPRRIREIKAALPSRIKVSRAEDDPLRSRLEKLVFSGRTIPDSFDRKPGQWISSASQRIERNLERFGIEAEVFTLSGDQNARISAAILSSEGDFDREKPLVLLLSGNPPGTKESLVNTALFFAMRGYHAVVMDRRESARILDSKEKFIPNFTDPVYDALRLIDYLVECPAYSIGRIGVYGISAGAGEAKFAAALDERIGAAVLAVGITSFNQLFRNNGWIPTLSGMIIYPELGLGNPAIGKLSSEEFWEFHDKARPEHNAKAREIFRKIYPEFEDLDPEKVVPLIAPVPCFIVSGAQDDQFNPAGVVEVDTAVEKAYKKLGFPECSELFIQSREGHRVGQLSADLITAFFDRWLK